VQKAERSIQRHWGTLADLKGDWNGNRGGFGQGREATAIRVANLGNRGQPRIRGKGTARGNRILSIWERPGREKKPFPHPGKA